MTLLNQSLSTSPQNNLKEIQIYQSKILSKEVPSPATPIHESSMNH